MSFKVEYIDHSAYVDPVSGQTCEHSTNVYQTARLYKVDGIDRQMSIGELVMAICLSRATNLENQIIAKMEQMARASNNLNEVTRLQEWIVSCQPDNQDGLFDTVCNKNFGSLYYYGVNSSGSYLSDPTERTLKGITEIRTFLTDSPSASGLGIASTNLPATATVSDAMQAISSKLDSLNTQNQKETIELQSMTNKRDQSYDLITNMLKSMSTVIGGITANFAR